LEAIKFQSWQISQLLAEARIASDSYFSEQSLLAVNRQAEWRKRGISPQKVRADSSRDERTPSAVRPSRGNCRFLRTRSCIETAPLGKPAD
jgi:hypothetical protein